jgi:hypothetical protein
MQIDFLNFPLVDRSEIFALISQGTVVFAHSIPSVTRSISQGMVVLAQKSCLPVIRFCEKRKEIA